MIKKVKGGYQVLSESTGRISAGRTKLSKKPRNDSVKLNSSNAGKGSV
jgi:hypothetical protein